jgi:hypothetical protein
MIKSFFWYFVLMLFQIFFLNMIQKSILKFCLVRQHKKKGMDGILGILKTCKSRGWKRKRPEQDGKGDEKGDEKEVEKKLKVPDKCQGTDENSCWIHTVKDIPEVLVFCWKHHQCMFLHSFAKGLPEKDQGRFGPLLANELIGYRLQKQLPLTLFLTILCRKNIGATFEAEIKTPTEQIRSQIISMLSKWFIDCTGRPFPQLLFKTPFQLFEEQPQMIEESPPQMLGSSQMHDSSQLVDVQISPSQILEKNQKIEIDQKVSLEVEEERV